MATVLHYKSIFLNRSETFIARVVDSHQRYDPVAATMTRGHHCEKTRVYTPSGTAAYWNRVQLRLNRTPGFMHRVVDREKPAVVHAHFGLDGYRMIGVARKARLPLVVSFYGHDVSRLPLERGWRQRYRILARHVEASVAASEAMRLDLIHLGFPESKIAVVKFGLNLSRFQFRTRERAGPRLLLVGRLVEKKGHVDAIEAVRILAKQGTACTLDFLGDGPLETSLKSRADQLGLASAIRFRGHVDNSTVRKALGEHDVLLAPSVTASDGDKEGMPNTILEGLACGIPVIATRHAGIPEVVIDEKTGLLVDERDPDRLAGAIHRLMTCPELVRTTTREGRKLVEREHEIGQTVSALEDVYDSVRTARESLATE